MTVLKQNDILLHGSVRPWMTLALFVLFYTVLVRSFIALLAPARIGGFMELGAPSLWIAGFLALCILLYLLRKEPLPFRLPLCALCGLGIACIGAHAFYVYPPLLNNAYYWHRYAAHPIYGVWEYMPASLGTFMLAPAICIWFLCEAFPTPAGALRKIVHLSAGIGGYFLSCLLIEAVSTPLSPAPYPQLPAIIIIGLSLCFLWLASHRHERLIRILSAYSLTVGLTAAGLQFVSSLPPYTG